MKIKTVCSELMAIADSDVNELLDSGWQLVRREIVQNKKSSNGVCFYAELVKSDDREEEIDPVAYAEAIRRYCASVPMEDCKNGGCPMGPYCDAMLSGKTPEDWPLPEGGAE